MRIPTIVLVVAVLSVALTASAQSPLSLSEAIARARTRNPDAGAAAAAEREAGERVTQVRASYFPKLDVVESWQRGNQPVFVFSSVLAQRQFTSAGFALDALNHPAAVDNYRAAVSFEQPLFDRATSANVRAASIGHDMATLGQRLVDHDLTSAVTEAFGGVLSAAARSRVAAATLEAARADRKLAVDRRDAGRVTDADVLQLELYLTRALEQQVQATLDERIARARLNQLLHEPLSTTFTLDSTPPSIAVENDNPAALENEALRNRPEVAIARLQERLADATIDAARAAFLPHVAAQGGWELNGGTWSSRSSSWVAGVVARVNVFNGFADKARLAEAHAQARRQAFERDKAETMVRLDVQIALARLEAARASEVVGRAAADRARESRRIVRDRYESGLTDAATLMHSADAVQLADAQQTAARVNILTATANLQRALGRS
jgi:outer membrane protein